MKVINQALLAAALICGPLVAGAQTFAYTGTIQTVTIATPGMYHIVVNGAAGGGSYKTASSSYTGGTGAQVSGDVFLDTNTQLAIVVGSEGTFGATVTQSGSFEVYSGGGGGEGENGSYGGGGGCAVSRLAGESVDLVEPYVLARYGGLNIGADPRQLRLAVGA